MVEAGDQDTADVVVVKGAAETEENIMNEGALGCGGGAHEAVKKIKSQQVRTRTAKYLETSGNSADNGESISPVIHVGSPTVRSMSNKSMA